MLSPSSIAHLRLRNQWVDAPVRGEAAVVVERLVAVQSQDYAGAKWALGLRMRGAHEAQVERAFNEGEILRTHVLRPTWHFVLPQDIRWMLALSGPRVLATNAGMERKAGLDGSVFTKAEKALVKALNGGKHLTRDELRHVLNRAGVRTEGEFRFAYILMHAELAGVICSGPRRGRQFTYALLEERAPAAPKRSRNQALAELARRYFLSRGPATEHDFAKWSGLTLADVRVGLEEARKRLHKEAFEGQDFWFGEPVRPQKPALRAHLLSVYDEFVSSYRGHNSIAPEEISRRLRAFGNALTGIMVLDGTVIGTWKRVLTKNEAVFKLDPFRKLTSEERQAMVQAAGQYAEFHGVSAAFN